MTGMDGHSEDTRDVKGVEHPPAEPRQDLHVCVACSSQLVYPLRWEESGPQNWSVRLRCPDCAVCRDGIFSQGTVDAFEEVLDRGTEALTRECERVQRANMADDVERFVGALNADALLPEDF